MDIQWFNAANLAVMPDMIAVMADAAFSLRSEWSTEGAVEILCTGGCAEGLVDGVPFMLSANDAFLLLPNQHLSFTRLSADLTTRVVVMTMALIGRFSEGNDIRVYRTVTDNPVHTFSAEEMMQLIRMTDLLMETIAMHDNPNRLKILTLLIDANYLMHGDYLHTEEIVPSMQRPQQLMFRFQQLVDKNYIRRHEPLFYATRLNVTPKYLSICATRLTGHSAGWWIDANLLRDADYYLLNTDFTVQEIAFRLGFTDVNAFGKFFRRRKGIAPTAFRKVNRKAR